MKGLKKQITMCVKGLGWSEYHTAWSANGKQHSMEHLTHHLNRIITGSASKNKQGIKSAISLPSRRPLPSLDIQTVDIRSKNEEDATLSSEMKSKCNEERLRLINEGLRDEIRLRQPSYAPHLKVDMKLQYAFRCADEDESYKIIEWCAGQATKVSNGSNFKNIRNGPRYFRKGGAVEAQWDANAVKSQDVSYSIVEIKKTLFNYCNKFGWRLHFDAPLNSIALQAACKAKNNNDEEEFTHDI